MRECSHPFTCHVSHFTGPKKNLHILIFFFFYVKKIGQSGGASWWRVCYQRGLPRLVFTLTWFEPEIFYQKKCVNYDKSNLLQNSVKAQKTQIVHKKMPKSNVKFQNVLENAIKKTQNSDITHFLDKTA